MQEAKLEKLLEIGGLILSQENFEKVLAQVNHQVSDLLETGSCTIYVVDKSSGPPGKPREIYSMVGTGEDVEEIRLAIDGSTLPGHTAQSGQPLQLDDPSDFQKMPAGLQWNATPPECKNLLVVPIKCRGEVVAVLEALDARIELEPNKDPIRKLTEYLAVSLNTARETIRLKRAFNAKRSIEQILVDEGVVSAEKMEDAQFRAGTSKRPVHKVLNSLYHLPEKEYARAVAIKYNKPFFEWSDASAVDAANMRKAVPERSARQSEIAPLKLIRFNGEPALRVVVTAPRFLKRNFSLDCQLPIKEVMVGAKTDVAQLMATIYLGGPVNNMRANNLGLGTIIRNLEEKREQEIVDRVEIKRGIKEDDGPVVNLVHRIIEDAWRVGVSDIHIEPCETHVLVRHRKDGTLRRVLTFPVHARRAVVARIKIMAGMDITVRNRPQDGKMSFREYRPGSLQLAPQGAVGIEIRVGTLPTVGEDREDVVMRLLPNAKPIPLQDMQMRPYVYHNVIDLITQPYGLFLVVGPTGSGKTTTLHSCLQVVNSSEVKILTVEDPVEVTQEGLRQVQVQRKMGLTFATALRQFLRQDPDIIMVGECRDEETAQITIEAALTGHMVFSTLHTNSASETVTRLLDMNLEPFTFADALRGVLAQRLVRTLCAECKEVWKPTDQDWSEMNLEPREDPLYRPVGCAACAGSGYRGRMGIHELLVNSAPVKELISSRATVSQINAAARENGMSPLFEDGKEKAYQGRTTIGEIRRVCLQVGSS